MNNPNLDKALNKMALHHETNSREEEYLRTHLAERLAMPIRSTVSRTYYNNQVVGKINKYYPDNEFHITTDLLLKLFHTRLKECSEPISWRNSDFLDSLYAVITDKKVTSRHQFFKENHAVFMLWYGEGFNIEGVKTEEITQLRYAENMPIVAEAVTDPPVFQENIPSEATPIVAKNDQNKESKLRSRMIFGIAVVATIILCSLYFESCAEQIRYRVFFASLENKDSIWSTSQLTFFIKRNNTVDAEYKGMFRDYPEMTLKGTAFEGQKAVQVNFLNREINDSGSLLINNGYLNKDWWQRDTLFGIYLGISRNEEPTAYKAILVKETDDKVAQVNDFIRDYIKAPDKYGIASRLFEGGLPR